MSATTEQITRRMAHLRTLYPELDARPFLLAEWRLMTGLTQQERENGWAHVIEDALNEDQDLPPLVLRYCAEQLATHLVFHDPRVDVEAPGTVGGYLAAVWFHASTEAINWGLGDHDPHQLSVVNHIWTGVRIAGHKTLAGWQLPDEFHAVTEPLDDEAER